VPFPNFAKNTNKNYRKRKWVFQNRIETNMQTCFPPFEYADFRGGQ
jgi:hypothetical protein